MYVPAAIASSTIVLVVYVTVGRPQLLLQLLIHKRTLTAVSASGEFAYKPARN